VVLLNGVSVVLLKGVSEGCSVVLKGYVVHLKGVLWYI
jgi:hypothetical protein